MKNKDSDNRCEKEKGKKMTSKEEKPITFTLKDGNLVSIEGSRGVIQAVDEGRFYVRDGEDLDIKIGDDRLFALSGEVIITPDGSYIKVKGSDIQLKMGDKSILISRGTIRIFDNTGGGNNRWRGNRRQTRRLNHFYTQRRRHYLQIQRHAPVHRQGNPCTRVEDPRNS